MCSYLTDSNTVVLTLLVYNSRIYSGFGGGTTAGSACNTVHVLLAHRLRREMALLPLHILLDVPQLLGGSL